MAVQAGLRDQGWGLIGSSKKTQLLSAGPGRAGNQGLGSWKLPPPRATVPATLRWRRDPCPASQTGSSVRVTQGTGCASFSPLSKMPMPGYHRPFYAKELCFLLPPLWAERKHRASCPGTKLSSPQRPENKQLESRLHTEATLGTARPLGRPCSQAWKTLPGKALQRGAPTTGGREPTRKAPEAPWLGKWFYRVMVVAGPLSSSQEDRAPGECSRAGGICGWAVSTSGA